MRKSIVVAVSACALVFCLAGCGSQSSAPAASTADASAAVAETSDPTSPAVVADTSEPTSPAVEAETSEQVEAPEPTPMYSLGDIYIYEAADYESEVLGWLPLGDEVQCFAIDEQWAQISYGELEGFVEAAYLTESADDAAAAVNARAEAEAEAWAQAQAAAAAEAQAQAEAEAAAAQAAAEEAAAAEAAAQAEAEAAAAQAAAEAEEAAKKAEKESGDDADVSKSDEPTIVSTEYIPPCDGHEDGYTVITYSDGSEEVVEGKI